jgi:hypothetical protein
MRLAFLGFVQHNMQSVILGAEIGSSVSLEEEEEERLNVSSDRLPLCLVRFCRAVFIFDRESLDLGGGGSGNQSFFIFQHELQ